MGYHLVNLQFVLPLGLALQSLTHFITLSDSFQLGRLRFTVQIGLVSPLRQLYLVQGVSLGFVQGQLPLQLTLCVLNCLLLRKLLLLLFKLYGRLQVLSLLVHCEGGT